MTSWDEPIAWIGASGCLQLLLISSELKQLMLLSNDTKQSSWVAFFVCVHSCQSGRWQQVCAWERWLSPRSAAPWVVPKSLVSSPAVQGAVSTPDSNSISSFRMSRRNPPIGCLGSGGREEPWLGGWWGSHCQWQPGRLHAAAGTVIELP